MQASVGRHSCGRDNPPEARFCVYCGAELAMPAGEPPAASDLILTNSVDLRTPTLPTTAPVAKAGVWQRIVLGLAALLLLLGSQGAALFLWSLPFWSLPFGGVVNILVRVGFGYAAVRPPGGILRRLLVTVACLVILLVAAYIIAIIVFFTWFFQF